ncbi:MAG: hypothetical protein ACR2PL_06730 [Dehalococcoidia bacterium]
MARNASRKRPASRTAGWPAGATSSPRQPGKRASLIGLALAGLVAVAAIMVFVLASRGQSGAKAAGQGKMAPAFELNSTAGRTVSLADFSGKQNVLLFWYEHAG